MSLPRTGIRASWSASIVATAFRAPICITGLAPAFPNMCAPPHSTARSRPARPPAVVTWSDGELHFLIASDTLSASELVEVAGSVYRRKA